MKKLLLSALLILVLATSSQAYIYELNHQCENSCLQETGVIFNLTLDPGKWKDTMELQMIQIVDAKKGTLIALYNKSTSVSSKKSFYINETLPKYDGNLLINVSPCFTTRVPPVDRMVEDVFIATELTYCEKNNHTIPLLECLYSGNCDENSLCINNTCAELECGECQHVFDHRCISYQCCGNETCKTAQECLNNTCIGIGCAEKEFAENHTCIKLACAAGEYVANHSCIKVQAAAGRTASSTVDKEIAQAKTAAFSQKWLARIVEFPKRINSAVVYRVLEVFAFGVIVFLILRLLEAKTKIFIKLTNRGQK
ncbi:MAG: hypothetical protein V1702_04745 [Candidatus Woesearchaeota archaeon]